MKKFNKSLVHFSFLVSASAITINTCAFGSFEDLERNALRNPYSANISSRMFGENFTELWLAQEGKRFSREDPYLFYGQNHEGSPGIFDERRGIVYPILSKDLKNSSCFLPKGYEIGNYPKEDVALGRWILAQYGDQETLLDVLLGCKVTSIHRVLGAGKKYKNILATLGLIGKTIGTFVSGEEVDSLSESKVRCQNILPDLLEGGKLEDYSFRRSILCNPSLLLDQKKSEVEEKLLKLWESQEGAHFDKNNGLVYAKNKLGSIGLLDQKRGIFYPIFEEDRKRSDAFLPKNDRGSSYSREDLQFGSQLLNRFPSSEDRVALCSALLGVDNTGIHRVLSEGRKNKVIMGTLGRIARAVLSHEPEADFDSLEKIRKIKYLQKVVHHYGLPKIYQGILEANPGMPEETAKAWAYLTPRRGLFKRTIDRIDQNKAWGIHGGHGNLYRRPVPGDGDCLFFTLDTTRAEATKILNDNLFGGNHLLNREKIEELKDMLAQAIYFELFKVEDGLPDTIKTEEAQILLQDYHHAVITKDNLTRNALEILNIPNPNNLELLANFLFAEEGNELAQAAALQLLGSDHTINLADRNLRAWCRQDEQLQAFINLVIGGNDYIDVHWNLGGILGEINGYNVIVYEAQDENTLNITSQHDTGIENVPTKHIFYNGVNHFDKLLTAPNPIIVPDITYAADDWIDISGKSDLDYMDIPNGVLDPVRNAIRDLRLSFGDVSGLEDDLFQYGRAQEKDKSEIAGLLDEQIDNFFMRYEIGTKKGKVIKKLPYGERYDSRKIRVPRNLERFFLTKNKRNYLTRQECNEKRQEYIEQEYNRRHQNDPMLNVMKQLEKQIDENREKVEKAMTPLVLMEYLSSNLVGQKMSNGQVIKFEYLPPIVDMLGIELDAIPEVKFSKDLPYKEKLAAIRVIEAIVQEDGNEMTYFVVDEDGGLLMAEDSDSELQPFVPNVGLDFEEFQQRDPDPVADMEIIDEIITYIGKMDNLKRASEALGHTYACKFLLENRKAVLKAKPSKCIWDMSRILRNVKYGYKYGSQIPIHFEKSKSGSYWFDGIPLNQRLNNFNNVLIGCYQKAKEAGEGALNLFLRTAFSGNCLDGRSESLVDYVQKNIEVKFFDLSTDLAIDHIQGGYSKLATFVYRQLEEIEKRKWNEQNIRSYLNKNRKMLTVHKNKKEISDEDIDGLIQFAKNVMYML